MNILLPSLIRFASIKWVGACALLISLSDIHGQDEEKPFTGQTNKDIPSGYHKYFGQRVNSWKDRERQIAKIDLDADMNQDGVVSDSDPADGGAFEATPPGLILGEKELSRVVIRVLPYRVDFDGEVVVTLEVEGINRNSRTGDFGSFEEEVANMGHIRVWKEASKKTLLLDSKDASKRVAEFTTSYNTYPYNLPIAVPRFVFVEGVNMSPQHIGDIRLLVTVSHRSPHAEHSGRFQEPAVIVPVTAAKEPVPVIAEEQAKKIGIKTFRTSFDHILLTVRKQPQLKEFIKNNNEGAWVPPPGWTY